MDRSRDVQCAFRWVSQGRARFLLIAVTVDRRSLVAVGCDEGVWIGLRHDARSLRKVLHVKAVTNIAVLEEFGIFLVLQDKVSFYACEPDIG